MSAHQYVSGCTGRVINERFYGDPLVSFLYSRLRERPQWLYRALTSARLTDLVAALLYDNRPLRPDRMRARLARQLGIDYSECCDDPAALDTPRKAFERRIRYWECRPMDADPAVVVSPSDARVLTGALREDSALYLKDKFFQFDELLGEERGEWLNAFRDGDFAVFRLTPEKYHYNHTPVSGVVRDFYELDGRYQSCHPAVVVAQGTPFSKNRRTVTVIDTDVPHGTGIGLVAMIEVVALMIGGIVQCYSRERYDRPVPVRPGLWLERGLPKSLFRPGSSTVVLLFQRERVAFSDTFITHRQRADARSRFSEGWGVPLIEIDVRARSALGRRRAVAVKGERPCLG